MEYMEGEFSMDEEEEFENCSDDIEPDRGIYHPVWVLKAAIQSSTSLTRWSALAGLAHEMEQWDRDDLFSRDEVIDIVVQSMYTGHYVNPFEHGCTCGNHPEGTENPITETEIQNFTELLDFFEEGDYTDDEDND